MVIDNVTGSTPQEPRKTDRHVSDAKGDNSGAVKNATVKPVTVDDSYSTEVSARSRAAITAYRIASESKPDIARATRVGQIKAQMMHGTYKPLSASVANSVLMSVVNGF